MNFFIQQLINGLTLGSIYGLIAIGYTMVYGIIGMINFAHGDVYMIGAFIALITFLALKWLGLASIPLILLFVLLSSMFFTALYGYVIERIAYRPLRHSFRLAPLISAIGMSIFLQNFVQLAQGARTKPLPPVIQGGIMLSSVTDDYPIQLGYLQMIIFSITIVLMIVFTLIIQKTKLGLSQRATQQDKVMAQWLGIDIDKIISTTFVLGAILAAVAGVMVTLYYGEIDFFIGFSAGIKAFTAAVLGGIGSLPGAMLGGMLIGLIEALWSGYGSIDYKDVAVFFILIGVLLFRPSGLLGINEREKV